MDLAGGPVSGERVLTIWVSIADSGTIVEDLLGDRDKNEAVSENLDTVAQMSGNPAIGGVARARSFGKSAHSVSGRVIDATGIHFRMLNPWSCQRL
jgi:hypothetical protein